MEDVSLPSGLLQAGRAEFKGTVGRNQSIIRPHREILSASAGMVAWLGLVMPRNSYIFEWSDEQLLAEGLDKKRIKNLLRTLDRVVLELDDLDLAVYVASDRLNLHQKSRHPQSDPNFPDYEAIIASLPGPFDGGDW
jgi:hypothetical protein